MNNSLTCDSRTGDEPRTQGRAATAGAEATAERSRSREWSSAHPVNLRLSLPLLFRRYYITIVAGRERRCAARLAEERMKHPLITAGNMLFLMAIGTTAGLAFLFIMQVAIRMLFASG